MDIWDECQMDHSVASLGTIECLSIFGRPAFFAYMQSSKKIANAEESGFKLLELLQKKLICSHVELFGESASSDSSQYAEACLAVLGVRSSINVTASSKLAAQLTASHMREVVGISHDRESVHTLQYLEPCLALAASLLIHRAGWQPFLDHLRVAVSRVHAEPGYRGEICAQILVLMALDRLMAEILCPSFPGAERSRQILSMSFNVPLIPLASLVEVFVGKEEYAKLIATDVLPLKMKGMFVRVLQFVQFFVKPSPEKITQMFQRAAGIVCKVNSKNVDLILPVVVIPPGLSAETVIPSKENMSVCLIQVKCRKARLSDEALESVVTNLTRENCVPSMSDDLNYLSLVLELGHGKKTTLHVKGPSSFSQVTGKQIAIAVASLRAEHVLDPGLDNLVGINSSFRSLLRSSYNPSLLTSASRAARESVTANHPITMV